MKLHLIIDLSEPDEARYLLRHEMRHLVTDVRWQAGDPPDTHPSDSQWAAVTLEPTWMQALALMAAVRQDHPLIGMVVTDVDRGACECVDAYLTGADIFMNAPVCVQELDAMAQSLMRRRWRQSRPPKLQPGAALGRFAGAAPDLVRLLQPQLQAVEELTLTEGATVLAEEA